MEIAHEIQARTKFFNAAAKKRLTLRLATPYLGVLESLRAACRSTILNAAEPSRRHTRDNLLDARISRSTIIRAQTRTIGDADSLKLNIQINAFLLDRSFEEAKVLKNFLDTFDSVEKNPKTCIETTRNFLTGLKERIMDVRFALLVAAAPPHSSTTETQADSIGREVELCIEKAVLLKLHDKLIDNLAKQFKKDDQLIEQHLDVLRTKPQIYFGVPSNLEATSKWQLAIIELNEIATLFLPQDKLRAILNCIAAIVDTAQFESDRRLSEAAKGRVASASVGSHSNPSTPSPSPSPTTSLAVPSSSPHSSASTGVAPSPNTLAAYSNPPSPTPSSSTNTEAPKESVPTISVSPKPVVSKPVDLSADDLLPILIYVVVHSKLSRLESQCQFLWQMSDPADLVGEAGYYLTMLSSAVEYIKQHDENEAVPPSSQPLAIGAQTTRTAATRTFGEEDSDSEGEVSPPEPAPSSSTWLDTRSISSSYHASPSGTWDSSSSSSLPLSSSPQVGSAPPGTSSRPFRASVFVIGSTRGPGSGIISHGLNSTSPPHTMSDSSTPRDSDPSFSPTSSAGAPLSASVPSLPLSYSSPPSSSSLDNPTSPNLLTSEFSVALSSGVALTTGDQEKPAEAEAK